MNLVCVIEDNLLNLKLINDILVNNSSLPLSIICFDDPNKFLNKLINKSEHSIIPHLKYNDEELVKFKVEKEEDLLLIDCFILDVFLPNMSGLEVLRKIKQYDNYKYVPVIIQTGSDDKTLRNRAFELGCADFIIKPFHFKELLNRVMYHTLQYQKFKELQLENYNLKKHLSDYIH